MSSGNPARNALNSGSTYARSDKKKIGEYWSVNLDGEKYKGKVVTIYSVKVQSYNLGSQYGHNRLGKADIFVTGVPGTGKTGIKCG